MSDHNRIDLWLKHVCLFRTRSEAGKAVRGGHVKLNGQRAKPAASVTIGDSIEITRSDRVQTIEVRSIPDRQVARKESREHYEDHTPPQPKRDPWGVEPQRITRGKLSKKDRRELRKLKGQ